MNVLIPSLLLSITLIVSILPYGYSQGIDFNQFSPDKGFGFKITELVWAIQEELTFDPERKANIKMQHAVEIQDKIETMIENKEPIPVGLEESRQEKLSDVRKIIESSGNEISKVDELKLVGTLQQMGLLSDVNEIRTLYGQFYSVLNSDNEELQNEYNDRVNSLGSWDRYCIGDFDIKRFKGLTQEEQFDLLTDYCEEIKNVDRKTLIRIGEILDG